MGRIEVEIPDDLYRQIEYRDLPISEWVERTIRAELEREREEKRKGAEEYYAELVAEVGEPTPEEIAEAEALVDRLMGRAEERRAS